MVLRASRSRREPERIAPSRRVSLRTGRSPSGLPVLHLSSAKAISMADARLARKDALRARRECLHSIAPGVSPWPRGSHRTPRYAGRSSLAAAGWGGQSLSGGPLRLPGPPKRRPRRTYHLTAGWMPPSPPFHQIELEMARLAMLSSSAPFNQRTRRVA